MRNIQLIFICILFVPLLNAQIPEGEFALTASSTLPPGSTSDFSPENLMDGGPDCWAEGAKGNGVGETLQLDLMYSDQLKYVMIKNGFGHEKYWESNARLKKVRIKWGSGEECVIHLKDSRDTEVYGFYNSDAGEGNNPIIQDAPQENSFTFEILEVYPGTRWKDLCITEIGLNQWYYDGFELSDNYIIKNIYRDYLDGIYDVEGNLYADNAMTGIEKVEIKDGYVEQDLLSGDGTFGVRAFQVFITGTSPASYLLQSETISEISQESMEGKLDENGNPFWNESYSWEIHYYNPGKKDFDSYDKANSGFIFDKPPWHVFANQTDTMISSEDVWISIEKPGIIGARLLEEPDGKILYYRWNGNKLVLQSEE